MLDIHNYDIELIEEEILMKYANNPCNYADCDCLLSLRKDMINQRALAHQEEILPDIIAFNEKLREALKEMYDRAHRLWDSTKEQKDYGEDIELTAKCFLGNDYPKLHPVQSDDRQELWAAISDSG